MEVSLFRTNITQSCEIIEDFDCGGDTHTSKGRTADIVLVEPLVVVFSSGAYCQTVSVALIFFMDPSYWHRESERIFSPASYREQLMFESGTTEGKACPQNFEIFSSPGTMRFSQARFAPTEPFWRNKPENIFGRNVLRFSCF